MSGARLAVAVFLSAALTVSTTACSNPDQEKIETANQATTAAVNENATADIELATLIADATELHSSVGDEIDDPDLLPPLKAAIDDAQTAIAELPALGKATTLEAALADQKAAEDAVAENERVAKALSKAFDAATASHEGFVKAREAEKAAAEKKAAEEAAAKVAQEAAWKDICDTVSSQSDKVGWLMSNMAMEGTSISGVELYPKGTAAAAVQNVCPQFAGDLATAQDRAQELANQTPSQKQAIAKAEEYLDYTAFSREGLIEQLVYEQFSTEDATFAVDHITVDWNEQAVAKAKEYLDYSAFSRGGLIDQLRYEGFTREQAEFGVTGAGL